MSAAIAASAAAPPSESRHQAFLTAGMRRGRELPGGWACDRDVFVLDRLFKLLDAARSVPRGSYSFLIRLFHLFSLTQHRRPVAGLQDQTCGGGCMSGVVRRIVLVCAVLLAAVVPAAAQVSTGEIFGKVTDGTGAVLPGVTVTLASPALIQAQTVVTAGSGGYRFPSIPIGTYQVSFDLAGFKKVVRGDVIIQAGFNAEINARLELSTVQETVTVTGASPVVDTKSTTLAASFTKDMLEKIPNARDPWVIIEQTPGMVMSGVNVGGNLSGQQTSFNAMGSNSNQQWNMNGAVVSDIASGNSSPTYYDFDSFEEIQITTAGADASQQGGGVQVNFITRSGSNNFTGYGRFYNTNDKCFGKAGSCQSINVTDDMRARGAGGGNPIQNIRDMGAQLGGPIQKNKAWFWGAMSRQDVRVGILGFYDTAKAGCQAVAATGSSARNADGSFVNSIPDIKNCLFGDLT